MPPIHATSDPRLKRGKILLLEDEHHLRVNMARMLASPGLMGEAYEVIPVASIEELQPTLVAPLHGRRTLARPPLVLIIADWRFGRRTLLDAFPFFDAVYPFTGMLVYSGAPDVEPIVRECARRKIVWLPKPFGAAQLRTIIERVGIPRDDERIELRRLLIQLASRGRVVPEPRDMPEHLLRVAEGRVLDCLDKRRGAIAHGLEESSIAQYALDIKSRTGMSLEDLRSTFFQARIGRGAPASPLFDDRYDASFDDRRDVRPHAAGPGEGDATVRPDDEGPNRPRRRPSARRGR